MGTRLIKPNSETRRGLPSPRWRTFLDMVSGYELNICHEISRVQITSTGSFLSSPISMDVETEIQVPFPRSSSQNGFASAKRPRTDIDEGEVAGERVVNLSRDGFEHRNENGLFFDKRPYQPIDYSTSAMQFSRRFLPIKASGLVYESEDFRSKGETLYTPLKDDVVVNTRNIEQFTFTNGSFFIGDESSRFDRTVQGVSLNMWRFDVQTKKLYVSRSFVFTNLQEAQNIKRVLEAM